MSGGIFCGQSDNDRSPTRARLCYIRDALATRNRTGASLLKPFYLFFGLLSVTLGIIGIFLPLLPTVPFLILAAFCFARSNTRLETWLVDHPLYGGHIRLWRDRRAISRKGKRAALFAFAVSIALSLLLVPWPWWLATAAAALVTGSWIWRRPES